MKVLEGNLVAEGLKIGIVAARFNEFIVSKLIGGAEDALKRHGVREEDIELAWVPGAFEIPLIAQKMAHSKKYDAVILNADSTQVYTEPLIATAKIKEHEKENIEHYLFDVVSLNDDYTLYDYQKDGRRLLDRFISENKNVIIVGGSGLYVKALLYNYVLEDKKEIDIDFSEYSNEELKNNEISYIINSNNKGSSSTGKF